MERRRRERGGERRESRANSKQESKGIQARAHAASRRAERRSGARGMLSAAEIHGQSGGGWGACAGHVLGQLCVLWCRAGVCKRLLSRTLCTYMYTSRPGASEPICVEALRLEERECHS